jgi:hypothetical protein
MPIVSAHITNTITLIIEDINLKSVYVHAANNCFTRVLEIQDAQAQRFLSPLISFDVFRDHFANHQTRRGQHAQVDDNQKKLLPYFLEERVRLRALVHLPTLVHFYKLINEAFAYKLTQQQTLALTVPQCIQLLGAEGPNSELATTLVQAWEEFKHVWTNIPNAMPLFKCYLTFRKY